ncbi:BgTH12-02961 [Blumeria graminis f. sp. triticale]|uniref:Bgt-677 n=3 Tax=Blumeria graminis TaxID=34373 RepID=A0A381L7T2_BLUGR|nr:Plasma membrane ATP-binding cassette (ABC) transporter multidrug transporter [Blumeria graminis f. sp. tritici 96224]CAD6503294.1 BgTH12-02961 [Blumeria graminis f. sp. triticale]VDB89294.1 Bgt-677 [Blumeria graminis f. sp. tritici]
MDHDLSSSDRFTRLRAARRLKLGREKTDNIQPVDDIRPGGSQIDVQASETEYIDLERRLTATSADDHENQSLRPDLERGDSLAGSEITECFSLEDTLRGKWLVAEQSGMRPKHIGVIWENLSVFGSGGSSNYVKTFLDAIISFFNIISTISGLLGLRKNKKKVTILDSFRGVAKPGEMVLVLGRPGSGCTTFLKVIANQRFGYTSVDGEVLYGPFDSETFSKRYRGETVYNQEDDVHFPTMTVGQTLEFALDSKMPGKRPGGLSKTDFKEEVIRTLLKMFKIEHTRNTMVGGPFIRGVSGGERKRVSIAEMLATSATVCAWDNSTRGLDASTALDYAKSLRIMTDIYKMTTFVSLYQASENIYRQFDKILVIDDGREVFFGPASEARAYFENLGFRPKLRMSTPDYITGCTDKFEREYAEGYSAVNAPHSPETFVAAFNQSRQAEELEIEMALYRQQLRDETKSHLNFQTAVEDAKMKGASRKSVYNAPFYRQVVTLMSRCFLMKWQDKFTMVVSWATSIIVAVFIGTIWLSLPQTSAGAFTRGGILFTALLFNAFQAFAELGPTMTGRDVVNKQRAYAFYRPSAMWLAQIIVDVAFASIKIFVFCLIVYFMCGLVREAGAFFTFYLVIVVTYLATTLLFRTIGCVSPDFDYAIKFASTMIILLILTTGYLIQYQFQKPWLRWLFYINPFGLGFSSLMNNEFSRINLTCTAESLTPSGSGYNNISHQVCTLPGSVAGTLEISGSEYTQKAFSYYPEDLWRNFGIILLLLAFFLITNMFSGEWLTWGAGGNIATVFQRPNKERKELNANLVHRRDQRHMEEAESTSNTGVTIHSKATLTWEDLCYDVPTPTGQQRLLHNIFGYIRPGSLTALMGSSGAGKTTLLDVLAARKTVGVIGGDILVDGLKPGTSFQRGTSYAEQLDIHEPTQTVREALRFSADLRQPFEVPQSEKYAYVEEVLSLLEMEDLADAIIGDPDTGLSVEQRKRVTIGVELAAKPELLLFLDEPTSGLDSQSAFNIVRFLKKLANAGQAIICTIHQPNTALFEKFDRLLLLQRGGRTVYFGDIGEDFSVLRHYLEQRGAICPPDANMAEWMLEAIGAGTGAQIGSGDWADIWANSSEFARIKEDIMQMKARRLEEVQANVRMEEKEFAAPFLHQMKVVQRRTHLSFWRSPNYGFTRLFNHVIIALMTGLIFMNLDDSRTSLQYRIFVIFQISIIPSLILTQVQFKYGISRMIYYREASAKMYGQFVFSSALVIAEIPYSIICALALFLPIYYMPGFLVAPARAGYQFLMILLMELFSVTLGQFIAALTPSPFIAGFINPFVMITLSLFCGVTIAPTQLPRFLQWLYQLDPFTRLVGGMIVTELHGRTVTCQSSELNRFTAPLGQTCGTYMKSFFQNGGNGYLVNDNSSSCEYCAYKVGQEFYKNLLLDFSNRWRDTGIFTAMIGGNLIILFLASRFLNFNRR